MKDKLNIYIEGQSNSPGDPSAFTSYLINQMLPYEISFEYLLIAILIVLIGICYKWVDSTEIK